MCANIYIYIYIYMYTCICSYIYYTGLDASPPDR